MSEGGYEHSGLPARVTQYLKRVDKALGSLEELEFLAEKLSQVDRELLWIKLTWANGPQGEVLAMMKSLGPDGRAEIAFVGGESPVLVLAKMMREVERDRIKWRPDKFHDYRGNEVADDESD